MKIFDFHTVCGLWFAVGVVKPLASRLVQLEEGFYG